MDAETDHRQERSDDEAVTETEALTEAQEQVFTGRAVIIENDLKQNITGQDH